MLVIKDWQSEAHHQHQNPAEHGWQPTKSWSNITLNMSGAPPECWLLVLACICMLQNHLAHGAAVLVSLGLRVVGSQRDSSTLAAVVVEPITVVVELPLERAAAVAGHARSCHSVGSCTPCSRSRRFMAQA